MDCAWIEGSLMERIEGFLERLAIAGERTALALERLSGKDWDTQSNPKGEPHKEPPKTKAIRLLIEKGTGNITAVAKEAGVHPKTLYKWPETQRVIQRLRAIEAWEVRNPRAVRHDEV